MRGLTDLERPRHIRRSSVSAITGLGCGDRARATREEGHIRTRHRAHARGSGCVSYRQPRGGRGRNRYWPTRHVSVTGRGKGDGLGVFDTNAERKVTP